ncbi:MAG: polymerase sigma factor, sigma-70 family [Planctomycetaceae bacterium]|nr:polymerase sigma factor, sigma-70 family [Planctomycetaceae bacterium]
MPQESRNNARPGRFATTSWSVVLKANARDADGKVAFEDLCVAYWYPLFAYARRKGLSAQDAEDAVQSFLGGLFESGVVERANPERGRFRSFLITAFNQFFSQLYEYDSAKKRRPTGRLISIDVAFGNERYLREPADRETPESHFERAWALTVIERAIARLKIDWVANGREEKFDALKGYLTNAGTESGRELASKLGMSEGAVRVALHRLKSQFGQMLRSEVELTLESGADVDHELKLLLAALAAA